MVDELAAVAPFHDFKPENCDYRGDLIKFAGCY